MSDEKKLLPANVEIIDPIGEIRRYAKELWESAGSPEDKPWEAFFSQAEVDLVAGKSDGVASDRVKKPSLPAVEPDPELRAFANKQDDELLCALIAALKVRQNEHECICLGFILSNYSLKLSNGKTVSKMAPFDIANYLAAIAGEYSQDFKSKHGAELSEIKLEFRQAYWEAKLSTFTLQDEALANSDRNTIARLKHSLVKEGHFLELVKQ